MRDEQRIEKMPPPRKSGDRSLERLVELYDAWDKPDEAAKWRKVLQSNKTTKPRPVKKVN